MGGGSFDKAAYSSFARSTVGRSTEEIYGSRRLNSNLNPYNVAIRESRDSNDNPRSTPVIVGLDVTGSMGMLADVIAREGLGVLFDGILEKKPISDPHIMFMGIGDCNSDTAPLQVSQFEADNRVVEQLMQLWLEKGGGGNNYESYNAAWYFAAYHTEHDSFLKRGKKGYLFTVGDEEVPGPLTRRQIEQFFGDKPQLNYSTKELLEAAQRTYDVYHIIVTEGGHCRGSASVRERTISGWRELLGQKAIVLNDYKKLAETIVSLIQVAEGATVEEVAQTWGDGSETVLEAIRPVTEAGRELDL